jgi:hypothetical protein
VLRFGLLQDGDVGVGVFPESEEIFVRGEKSLGRTCAVLHSIEHTVNETVLRNQCCLLYAEEVDPCGLFQDIRTN